MSEEVEPQSESVGRKSKGFLLYALLGVLLAVLMYFLSFGPLIYLIHRRPANFSLPVATIRWVYTLGERLYYDVKIYAHYIDRCRDAGRRAAEEAKENKREPVQDTVYGPIQRTAPPIELDEAVPTEPSHLGEAGGFAAEKEREVLQD